ncbi:SRPBCC domain-containing protein [Povalibacter sp.]|uniref:SRPBCC family protein n=1 Tax=Povalibacter sp. TaxID=1962978 RepID=UPI002F3FE1BC
MVGRLATPVRILVLLVATAASTWAAAADDSNPQVIEGFINAPLAEVWKLFTTPEGYKVLGVPQSQIDLRVGGLIRSHSVPKGVLGDPETRIEELLAYDPERMLALRTRQQPASIPYPDAVAGTWSVIYFTPSGADMTHVRIVGLGYRDDPSSQALRKLFAESSRGTLDQAAKRYWPKCKLCAAEPLPAE